VIGLLMCTHLLFSCYVACNRNASVVCELKFTYLLTYIATHLLHVHTYHWIYAKLCIECWVGWGGRCP